MWIARHRGGGAMATHGADARRSRPFDAHDVRIEVRTSRGDELQRMREKCEDPLEWVRGLASDATALDMSVS
jgi:hypothetical protein